jgi:hypothetical protein
MRRRTWAMIGDTAASASNLQEAELGTSSAPGRQQRRENDTRQSSPSAPDVVPLFGIIDEFIADYPVLQELVTRRSTRVSCV